MGILQKKLLENFHITSFCIFSGTREEEKGTVIWMEEKNIVSILPVKIQELLKQNQSFLRNPKMLENTKMGRLP